MRFLADESVDRLIVQHLRDAGHAVTYVAELAPGIDDDAVLSLAQQSQSVLVTVDKDFGELVFLQGRTAAGVVLLRLAGLSSQRKVEIVLAIVQQNASQFSGAFTVVAPGKVRIRPANPRG